MATARRKYRLVSSRTAKNSARSSLQAKPGVVLDHGSSEFLPHVRDNNDGSGAGAPVVAYPDDSDKKYFSEPLILDIYCGRGKGSFCHPGNLVFQEVIRKNLDRYEQAGSKKVRGKIVSAIVSSLHLEHSLRFIKKDPVVGKWYVLSINEAHEKTGHAIRDQLCLMRRKQLSLQERTSLPTQPPMSCHVSISSRKSKRSTNKGVNGRPVPRKTKHQIQKKMIKKTTNPTQQADLLEEAPDLVSAVEEAHKEPSSDRVVGNGTVVPTSLSGDDVSLHMDHDQCDDLDKHLLDLHVLLQPQGNLEYMSPLSTLTTESQGNCSSPYRVSPESNQEVSVRTSTLQTTQELNNNEDDLEPIPLLPYIPHPAEYIQVSRHSVAKAAFNGVFGSPVRNFGF